MRLIAFTFFLLIAGILCLWTLSAWDAQISRIEKGKESLRIQEEKFSQQNNLNKVDTWGHETIIRTLPHYERHLNQSVQIRNTKRWLGFGFLGSAVIILLVSVQKIKRAALRLADREPEKSLSRGVSLGLTLAGLLIFVGAVILVTWPVGIRNPIYLSDNFQHAVLKRLFLICLLLWGLNRIYQSRLREVSQAKIRMGCLQGSLLLLYIFGFLLMLLSTRQFHLVPRFDQ